MFLHGKQVLLLKIWNLLISSNCFKILWCTCFLISEALRGEGAILVDKNGESPVKNLKNRDLATRDQVSRAIMKNMRKNDVDHVGLDLRYIDPEKIMERFPTILADVRTMVLIL